MKLAECVEADFILIWDRCHSQNNIKMQSLQVCDCELYFFIIYYRSYIGSRLQGSGPSWICPSRSESPLALRKYIHCIILWSILPCPRPLSVLFSFVLQEKVILTVKLARLVWLGPMFAKMSPLLRLIQLVAQFHVKMWNSQNSEVKDGDKEISLNGRYWYHSSFFYIPCEWTKTVKHTKKLIFPEM